MTLYAGDLELMVSPHVEIDTFEPKINQNAVVLAFKCTDEDAAYDLNEFIEFGPIDVMDCEVSPAPDADGFWFVFVELDVKNNKELAKEIFEVLKCVKYLTNISKWKYVFQTIDQQGILKV